MCCCAGRKQNTKPAHTEVASLGVGITGGCHDLLLVLLVVMLLVQSAPSSVWSSKEVCTIVGLCP